MSRREAPDSEGEGEGIRDANVEALRRSHEALRELYRISAAPDLTDEQRIERMLEVGCRRFGIPSAQLSVVDPDADEFDVEVAVGGGLEVGDSLNFSRTYCQAVLDDGDPQLIPDIDETVWADTDAHRDLGRACYVGGRVEVEGEFYGTVCFLGTEPREPFTEDERTLVELLVEWIGDRLEHRQLEREREWLHEAIESAESAITVAEPDPDGGRPLTYVNSGFEELTGYDRETVLGMDCRFLQGPETDPTKSAAIGEALDAGESVDTVIRNYRADGTAFWNELQITPVREDGEVVRFVGTQRDVSERVEQRETVTALLDRTRALLDAETTDEVARVAAAAVEEILGYDSLVRLHDDETGQLAPAAGSAKDIAAVAPLAVGESLSGQAYERGETLRFDPELFAPGGYGNQAETTDGLVVPLGEHGTLGIELPDPEPGGFDWRIAEILGESVTAALDRAVQRDRLRLYETAIEQGSEMTAVVGEDLRVELVSDSLAAFLGVDRDDLVGELVEDLLPESDLEAMATAAEDASSGKPGRVETTVTVDGEPRPVELEISMGEGGEPPLVAVVRDISELAETRGELSRERDRFASLFTHIPDPVAEYRFEDGEPVIRRCNEPFAEAFGDGRDPAELVGLPSADLVLSDDADAEAAREIVERVRNGEAVTEQLRRRTADGPREFLFRAFPFEAGDGRRAFGTYTDVTEQQRRQRRVEVLNRVLRHNVRNQINIADGNARLLAERIEDEDLERILDGLLSATSSVLSVSEKAREAERALAHDRVGGAPPDTVVGNVVEEFRAEWPDRTIEYEPPAEPAPVAGPDRLEPVLSNLLENAIEHNGPDVTVRVDLTVVGDRLEMGVTDDGCGIPDLERSLIGGEQEITQLHHGNGIGLWVVRWIVDTMGGDIHFEDEEGWHSVVVSVPLADD